MLHCNPCVKSIVSKDSDVLTPATDHVLRLALFKCYTGDVGLPVAQIGPDCCLPMWELLGMVALMYFCILAGSGG